MSTLIVLHEGLSNTAWIFFLLIGVWGTYRAIRGFGTDGSYMGAVAAGQLIFFAQAILGGILWLGVGSAPLDRPDVHLLYGVFALVFLPFIYIVVLKGEDTNRAQWIWAFCTLFMFGIALRSIVSATGYGG